MKLATGGRSECEARERYKGGLPGIDNIWRDGTTAFEFDIDTDKAVLGKQIAGSVLDNFEQAGVNCVVIKAKKQILEEGGNNYVWHFVDTADSRGRSRFELRVSRGHFSGEPDILSIETAAENGDWYAGVVCTTLWDDAKHATIQNGQKLAMQELRDLLGEGEVSTVFVRHGDEYVHAPRWFSL